MAKTTRKKAPRKKTATKKSVARKSGAEKTGLARSAVASAPEEAVAAHRLRQASVAAILDQVFGPFGTSDPKLWERRAYLLLVGSVYDRLATDAELGTDELVKLARVLAESRRSKLSRASAGSADGGTAMTASDSEGNGRLPNRFADMVRDLYGASVCDEDKSATNDAFGKEHGGVGG